MVRRRSWRYTEIELGEPIGGLNCAIISVRLD